MNNFKNYVKQVDLEGLQKNLQINIGFTKHIDCDGNEPLYNLWIKSEKINFVRTYALEESENAICDFLGQGHKLNVRSFNRLIEGITNENFESHVKECVHTRLGWGVLKGADIFKYEKGFVKGATYVNEISSYKGNIEVESRGDLVKYVKGIKELIVPFPKLLLVYIAGATGMVRQRLELDDVNIMINIYGDSSSGKTTAEKAALSFWGNPQKLMTTFNSTDNRLEEIMVNRQIVPVVIDDLLGANNYSSENAKRQCISDCIFRFSTGKSKGRYGETSNLYYGATLLSTESSLLKKLNSTESNGQFYRLIEIASKLGDMTSDAEHARNIESLVRWNYGLGAETLGKYMLSISLEELQAMYDKQLNKICQDKRIEQYQRIGNRYALIAVTAELMNSCFDFSIDIDAIIEILIDSFLDSINHKKEKSDSYYMLNKFIDSYKNLFSESRETYDSNVHWGAFDKDRVHNPLLCVETGKIAHLINICMFEKSKGHESTNKMTNIKSGIQSEIKLTSKDIDDILDFWRKQGWLECLHGRTVKRKLGDKNGVLMYCIVLNRTGGEKHEA